MELSDSRGALLLRSRRNPRSGETFSRCWQRADSGQDPKYTVLKVTQSTEPEVARRLNLQFRPYARARENKVKLQTFLPFETYEASAFVLDRQRLGKQRVEAFQILECLLGERTGWAHHPAVKMWAGYEESLCHYGMACCQAWRARGYVDNMYVRFYAKLLEVRGSSMYSPIWLGDPEFHRSHQSNLIRKKPEYYAQLFPGVPNDLPYVWPPGRFTQTSAQV